MKAKKGYLRTIGAKYLHDYLIEITFEDHSLRVIDLETLFKTGGQPFCRFAPLKLFKQFYLAKYGILSWGDNECDIYPGDIYAGKYDAQLEHA